MEDWQNVLRILRYLKGTMGYGINISGNSKINAFVDADYAGDIITRRSTTEFVIIAEGTPISWCSKLQH